MGANLATPMTLKNQIWFIVISFVQKITYSKQLSLIQGDRRESDGLKKKYSVDFQLEMDVFLQN